MLTANQNPEQLAPDKVDHLALLQGSWLIQNKSSINLAAGVGVAIREYETNVERRAWHILPRAGVSIPLSAIKRISELIFNYFSFSFSNLQQKGGKLSKLIQV
jgi:hypothetical protein